MSKQVWFLLPEQETLEDDLTTVSWSSSFSHQLQESMSDNSPQNSQVVPRLDLNINQTNSPSDSRESTQNDISSPSMHRGFSSDDNSGWKSETTETSEGNLSLSQYPLDDPSCGEESPQENNSLHEEALTSAITEVSKDFISGNFSPGKYPPVESDSSDGDHHLDGHTGAVYARYPESATGMSDCEWNPYGTDNDNETPRSSASDSEFRNIQAFTATSSMRQKDPEIRIPTGSMNNGDLNRMISNPTVTRDFVRIPTDTINEDKTRDTNAEDINRDFMRISIDKDGIPTMSSLEGRQFNRNENPSTSDKREQVPYRPAGISKSDGQQSQTNKETSNVLPASRRLAADIVKDSYAMYSPEKEFGARSSEKTDKTSTTSSTLLGSGDRTFQLTANQYIPGSHREMYGTQSYNQLSRNTELMPKASTSEIKGNVLSGSSSTTIVPDSQDTVETLVSSSMSSVDTARRESASKYGSSSSSKPSDAPYVPVGDRAKLLGLPEDFLDQPKPTASSDFAVPRITDLPLLSRVQIPEKDTDSPSNSKQESMSQRVSKLLEDASHLGTTLHHHLYSREALGLEGDREPTVLRSYSPLRKSDNFVQKSTERSQGSALLTKSGEQSVRSSLGDEVAKLMTKSNEGTVNDITNVPSNSSYVPLKINTIPSSETMNVISAQTYPSLSIAAVGGGPGSTDSQESADSLSQRVKKILSDTAYADRNRQSTAAPGGSVPTNFDYSRLQRDLQEIQSNLDPGIDYNMRISNPSPDFSKASDKSTESSKAHKLLWDHGADLGYDDSLSGRFFGTMKTDTETECDSTYSGKGYNGLSDTLELVNKPQKDTAEVVSDQVESDFEDRSLKVAPDVEEIIRRYQTEKPDKLMDSGDSSGLASKVMKILSQEPPRKQAISILKSAKQEEREMIKRMADKPKLDTSYDSSQESTNSSFVIQDKDVRKQLEWSQMSGIDKSINNSYLSGLKTEPFSALGNAKTFLSSQLAKNADRTFNHSIDIKTPYRHVLDCYPVYGVERTRGAAEVDQFGRTEPDGVKEAWADGASSQEVPAELLFGATSSDTANVRPGSRDHQRTYSDPRELSPEARSDSATVVTVEVATETEDGHTRSKSEEPRYGEELPRDRFYNLEPAVSATDRRAASSPHGNEKEKENLVDVRKKETVTTPPSVFRRPRLKNYHSFTRFYRGESSPSSVGQLSDSDNSSRRRDAARLRPYRPHGSRELYYTEDGEDSLAESITTVESNHTAQRRVTWNPSTYYLGSDDATAPSFPVQYLGSRKDVPSTSGIYGTKNPGQKDTLSTIDEKSLADDKERSGTDSGVDNPRSDLASSHGSNLSSYRRDMGNREDFTTSRVPGQYEDRLTLSTRSDPGDQYATPKRSTRHEHSDPRSDSRVYRDTFEREQYEPKPTKSRSETDLATLPDVDHKYSSPMYGDRFMELSSQPSPIYSHHTSMASPAVLANGANQGRLIDEKLMEDRLNVKPLEKGPNFITRQEETSYDRMAEFSQRELGDGINKDDKPGSTPYNKAYDRPGDDSFPMRTIAWRETEHDRLEPRCSGLEPGSREPTRSLESGNLEMDLNREPPVPSDRGQDYRPRVSSSESSLREVVRPLDRGSDFTSDRQPSEENVRPLDPGPALPLGLDPGPHLDTINPGYRQTDRVIDYVRDERLLNRGPDTEPPKERRTLEKGQNYYDMYRPRKEPPTRTGMTHHQVLIDDDTEELEFRELPRRCSTPYNCPDQDFEEMVKEEKAKIQIEYELQRRLKQKGYLQNSTDEKEFGAEYDHVPPNERAKSLQRKLEQESHRELPPNINDLWLKFQEMNQNESTSTINSSRMEAITDLLKNPTKHIVQKITDERTYEKAKERRIMQELSEKSRQEQRKDSRSERKRQELQNLRRLSEEESNGSYADILQEQQKKKLHGKHKKESRNPDSSVEEKQKKEMENKMKGSKKAKVDIPVHGDSIDTLYSIAEDASFEATPSKAEDSNQGKSKKSRQRHVIDPLMNKLKDKIESQRIKIDKERRKEIKRLDKLKKLEMLLTAKKKGKLSDQAIDVELNYVSTTSAAASSESSTLFGSETTMSVESLDNNKDSFDSVANNGDTTSTKDSSIEIQKVRTKKVKHGGMLDAYMASIGQGGKADESEASTEDLQVVRKTRSSKPGKSDKKKTKDQQNQMKTDFVDKETLRRERSKSPKSRRLKDASTNVPSPIIKSPVSKRKVRDVYVRSEAVQTSPCRSWSPPREDQGVISVPSMSSSFKRSVKTFDSRQQRQRSYSPIDSFSSTSPDRTLTNRSISPPQRQKKAGPGRKTKRSKSPPKPRICLPESDEETKQMKVSPPPKSRMFTPETPDDDLAGKLQDSPNGGLTWFVPMGQSKPWRQPLKERQAFAVSQEPWQPKSVSSTAWKDIVADNPVNKSIGESSKFDLDTTGHYKDLDEERSDEENFDPKPLSRLTLQEAFETYKQDAISKLRARQKRVALASKERTLQDMLEKERNRLFAEEKRRKEANPEAHPLSENLHKPKRRAISKGEMIEQTQKLYKKLPEVQNQKLQEKRMEDYSLNRLRAKVFNRRIQRDTLKKCENRGKRSPSKNIH
ncbi:uncharacterized protein LOC143073519 isoform X5 [Mytilus galloprovincialis]|uniref:uncharacterized protein LOC143073519 isoform X5 n=1 Tax=Mytilus galloprovincialis TaxID=29158 RepID=UPI003F7C42FC